MAINDIRSNLQPLVANVAAHAADGTINGISIDTADFELGLMFTQAVTAFTTGAFLLALEESDTGVFAGEETAIPVDQTIGPIGGTSLTALSANGDILPTVGVISNKRFVRANSIGGSTAVGTVLVMAVQKGEIMPVVD